MKTKVTFKVLSQGKLLHRTVTINHPEFRIEPGVEFNGFKFNPVSIGSQVIDYLDSIDKKDLMDKYDWDMILDYYIPKKRRKFNEIEDFINFLKPYINPKISRQVEAIISEHKDVLFGKGKSNETKAKELISIINITNKTVLGTLNMIEKLFNDKLKLE